MEVDSAGLAHVTADFYMRNLGSEAEFMQVRFPLDQTLGWGRMCGGLMPFAPIDDLRAWVDGQQMEITITYETIGVSNYPNADHISTPAGQFPSHFSADQEVLITIKYTGEPYGGGYSYVLETGAGWRGRLAALRFPYVFPLTG
jgi:hypothetical protein